MEQVSEGREIAAEILRQLGGRKFTIMTGAKNFSYAGDNGRDLTFSLPSGLASNKANKVRITLDPMDLYTVEFIRVNIQAKTTDGICRTISKHEGIYFDKLQELFTAETGLETRL